MEQIILIRMERENKNLECKLSQLFDYFLVFFRNLVFMI